MKQILLVDDDATVLEALLRQFYPHRDEWHVTTAGNGAEALRVAREQPLDVVVTDLLMPETDGIEMIMAFRREHPSVKIVAMSGGGRHVGTEPLRYARLLGARASLEKPFEFHVLRSTIQILLEPEPDATP